MDIRTLWVTRKSEEAPPELIQAWDEYCIEENDKGAKESFEKALEGIGSDLDQFRYIIIKVDDYAIEEAFKDTVVWTRKVAANDR